MICRLAARLVHLLAEVVGRQAAAELEVALVQRLAAPVAALARVLGLAVGLVGYPLRDTYLSAYA